LSSRNINLTTPLNAWIDHEVETGRHQNAALHDYRRKREAQDALELYFDSILDRADADAATGHYTDVTGREQAEALKDRINSEVTARRKARRSA
jgi:Arc/MetJ-type ribon-helix-helix transcriptional regulator